SQKAGLRLWGSAARRTALPSRCFQQPPQLGKRSWERSLPLVKAFMDYKERSTVWKTDHVLAVCGGITRASGLEYILTRKCPLPLTRIRGTAIIDAREFPQPILNR